MGAITKEMLTDEQFTTLLWYFDQYHKNLQSVPDKEIYKYNIIQRSKFIKVRNNVSDFWHELDKIN